LDAPKLTEIKLCCTKLKLYDHLASQIRSVKLSCIELSKEFIHSFEHVEHILIAGCWKIPFDELKKLKYIKHLQFKDVYVANDYLFK